MLVPVERAMALSVSQLESCGTEPVMNMFSEASVSHASELVKGKIITSPSRISDDIESYRNRPSTAAAAASIGRTSGGNGQS